MDTEKIIRDLSALPLAQQREIANFIVFLKKRYKKSAGSRTQRAGTQKLSNESFIGMWQSRKDMQDSASWVRNIRLSEWIG